MKIINFKLNKSRIRLIIISLIYLANLWLTLNLTAAKIPLFGFHSIIDTPNLHLVNKTQNILNIDYTKQDLEKFLDYLVSHNFWFLSAQELYDYFITESQPIPVEHIGQKPVMISFDDSYKTFYSNVIPVLENLEKKYHHKVKVVLFINAGTMAKQESRHAYNITCNNVREGLEKGFYDIQSHGLNHKKLTELNTEQLIYELSEAQIQLRKCTQGLDPNNTVASHIAYPYGAVNKKVEKYTAKYYLSGYLYNSRILKLGWWLKLKSRYQISRLSVNHGKNPNKLIRMAELALKITN